MNGWPNYVQREAFEPYFIRRQELSAEQGCVLWGQRVSPPGYRQKVLIDLHHGHPGICRMKARSCFV